MNAEKVQKREQQFRYPGKMLDTAEMLWTQRAKLYKPML